LVLRVDPHGVVAGVVKTAGHPLLTRAAEQTALLYRYRPFEVAGVPSEALVETSVAFVIAGRAPHPHTPFPDVTDLAQVAMEYGDGSVNLRVTGGGIVEYEGMSGVAITGKHQRRIARDEVQQLLQALRSADFFSLSDDYSVGATDVGTTTTSIQVGAAKKAVVDDWVQVPPVLKAVQEAMLKFSHSDQWTKGNADTVAGLLAETSDPRARRGLLSDALPGVATYGDAATVADILATGVDLERPGHNGARVNARNVRKQSALISAASGDAGFAMIDMGRRRAEVPEETIHRDVVVKMLLDAGADINARGWDGETALFSLEDEAVRELLRHHIDIEARNNYGETALVETVSEAIADLLVKAGANVNAQDKDGRTALFKSAQNNYVAKLRVLVKAPGIQLDRRDRQGSTALMIARKAHHEDCVQVLLAAGATL
jgi:ankyrin repeat protein